MKKGQCI